ncbi:MAG: 50S ribosomal protein L3 [Candidatus Binatia bacterium]
MIGLIGRKIGMSQIFAANGTLVPVTVIEAGPCTIVQKKTDDKDGYSAVQLGFGRQKTQRSTKSLIGHCQKANAEPFALLREFRTNDIDLYEVGSVVSTELFSPGEVVDVIGKTKGRGYSGVIKRHGMRGFPKTRGTHEYRRHGGAIGNRSYPGRIFKGKRMAGQYGNERVTARNLRIVDVRAENNLLLVQGAVPGARGGIVLIRKTVTGKK